MNNNNKITLITAVTGILTLSILAMASLSFNQVSAQFADCQTSLNLTSNPRTGTVGSSEYPSCKFIG